MLTRLRWASTIVVVTALAGCGSSKTSSATTTRRYIPTLPTTALRPTVATTLSPLVRAILDTPVGRETYTPALDTFLYRFIAAGRTLEQYVADQLQPFSSGQVTAVRVTAWARAGCPRTSPGAAADALDAILDKRTPLAAEAARASVVLLGVVCFGDETPLAAAHQQHLNAVANYTGAYLLSAPVRTTATASTTTLPAPRSGDGKELYSAVCTGGSAAIGATAWHDGLKLSRGGILGLALVAFVFSYCPSILRAVLG